MPKRLPVRPVAAVAARVLALVLCVACGAPGGGGDPGAADEVSPEPPAPWTSEFLEPALLIANRIDLVGPPGLAKHFVARQDPETNEYAVKATDQGLVQSIRPRSGLGRVEIRAQLDAWTLVAFEGMRVLERPTPCDVEVVARGDAFWNGPADGDAARPSRRGAELRFTGPVGP